MITHLVPANTNQVKNLLSTSIIDGLDLSTANVVLGVSADIIVSSGVARFVDNFTNPLKPSQKDKPFSGETLVGVDISLPVKVVMDENLNVTTEVFAGVDGPTERRTRVELGVVGPQGTPIKVRSLIGFDTQNQVKDASQAYGISRKSGLRLEANGVNLTFNRTAGVEFSPFYPNYPSDKKDLSDASVLAFEPVIFFDTWHDATQPSGFNFSLNNTILRVGVFDDGDADSTGPDGIVANNSAQIFRVYETFGTVGVLFGQTSYISIAAAVDALSTETFIQSPLVNEAGFRGFIIARGGATDLSLTSDALFFPPPMNLITTRLD
jgi:hypothetical protein